MLRKLPNTATVPAVIIALSLALSTTGCTPSPEPTPTTTPTESASASASPSTTPSPEPLALPDCATIYSPAVVATLTSEGRTSSGDLSASGMGGWGSYDDSITALFASVAERVSCTWILPASESGSTTTIVRLDDATRAAAIAAFTTAGYTASATSGGDLYAIEVETEFGSYTESHLLSDELWIGSVFAGGTAQTLTLDAAALLLP